MRLRSLTDRPFLGCSNYPRCRGLISNELLSAEVLAEAGQAAVRARPVPVQQALPLGGDPRPDWPVGFPAYGRSRGAPIQGASVADLEYYANGARRTLADPSKIRFHDGERRLLEAIDHELTRQRGAAPAAPQRLDAGPPLADPFRALVEGEPLEGVLGPRLFYPPTVEECSYIPACTLVLDEHQQRVVDWRRGEALVAAAAGSGKSTVLIERTAALIREGCPAETVLTLVYNRSAAEGLRRRLSSRLPGNMGTRVQAATFHSWAYALVKEWWPGRFIANRIVGTEEGPSPITLGLAAVVAGGLNEYQLPLEIKDMVKVTELAREALIDINGLDAVDRFLELPVDLERPSAEIAVRFARFYQQEKVRREVIDFADMLYLVNRVIAHGGARARVLRIRYQHVQVDEAQDVNPARLRIAEFLGAGARSLLWVGDFRQTIYSFTGSRPDLLRSRLDHGASMLTLPVNRRSTKAIVDAGNRIAEGHPWNIGGACEAATDAPAEKVDIWSTTNSAEEADFIAEEIAARTCTEPQTDEIGPTGEAGGGPGGVPWVPLADPATGKANYVCLVRTNAQAAGLECSFLQRNLPCRVLGATGGAWSTAVGRELLAYLRCGTGVVDKDILRVVNKPARFLKRAVVENALSVAATAGMDFNVFIAALEGVNQKGARQLKVDLSLLAGMEWPERVAEAVRLLQRDLQERAAESAVDEPDDDRSAAYKALGDVAIQMGSVQAIDAQIERMTRVGARDPAVEICTMHKSKGAEWHTVFVCGVTEGLLPHMKARDLEEECRLFYVAVTRAKHVAVISIGGPKASPFLRALGYAPPPPPAPPRRAPLLVGEAPGQAEVKEARPLVGNTAEEAERQEREAGLVHNPGLPRPQLRLVRGELDEGDRPIAPGDRIGKRYLVERVIKDGEREDES